MTSYLFYPPPHNNMARVASPLAVLYRLHKLSDKAHRMEYLRLDLPLVFAVVSLMGFYLAIFLSAEHSVSRLISTHG